MKDLVYLNYAATSYKKFPATIEALTAYLAENQFMNYGRNAPLLREGLPLLETRQLLAEFFQAPSAAQITFTNNATTSLNLALAGILQPGDHVITTMLEHHAVARPLHLLEKERGISVTYVACQKTGLLDVEDIQRAWRTNTKALVMTHASNVLGTILPIEECFQWAQQKGLLTVLDAAQTAGFLPIKMTQMAIDVLAFTGHKSLYGLAGIGGLAFSERGAEAVKPLITGGTGSHSNSFDQPSFLPDKFEAGTLNSLGILSLNSSIKELNKIGLAAIQKHERTLMQNFLDGLSGLPITILGTKDAAQTVPVVSIILWNQEETVVAQQLAEQYGIMTRAGLHCAPLAHETAGTLATGTLRFSFGWQTTPEEITWTIHALQELLI
ncbi:aminotransferase class V-fold PLP-dependent enzyme [Enterococcus faecalis]|uniref:selenocysteine lyase SclA n=1 Tax=Enterococcus TaxID=1350 RepID=UPI000FCC8B8F|nr:MULTISPECIES: selenocysteine lyase SclA [Enterococcus]EIT2072816.1 aminotransferase class V-fold PLP-dependent enzyme [Enterococcus faecalis]EKS9962411.1 aminotransferase class V-fold PLP-dependent enzyme [Enterococcus faecalis]MCD4915111.1 aminotransferase class V-fold PLP-dependent enzyme [Enterococcus faecalis]MCD5221114.1 aminotransferase class V-fold PLP-dependent enzyme [Enterococcus faecalis]MCD5237634.1 aminotransferase class V-fold PLP-dependent enzyme [Enterococcus faecalis]